MQIGRMSVPEHSIETFCQTWRVVELDVFGSVLREDFRADSDVDVMVEFAPDARWGLLEFALMGEELERIFGRRVDLVTRRGVQQSTNPYRREAILQGARRVYAAG